ncbi:MAG: helix-turn-helix domain-containing protein [Firmicutes bacterium]|nr:helix-turn-helix domain-containing protein [Bacillota bacterium]
MAECWECGRIMTRQNVEFTGKFKDEDFTVSTEGYLCECGYKTVQGDQTDGLNIAFADAYRTKYSLFTTSELLGFRKELNLSQQKFADFLGTNVQTIKKWEHGCVQDKSMNELIRLKMKEYYENINSGLSEQAGINKVFLMCPQKFESSNFIVNYPSSDLNQSSLASG